MLKKLYFAIFLTVLFISLNAAYVEVGTGLQTSQYIPVFGDYDYSWSRVIYTQEQLGYQIEITEIAYHVANELLDSEMINQRIYLKHTEAASIETDTYTNPADDDTYNLVFYGALTYNESGWIVITLDTPFQYNNEDNLEVFFSNGDGSSISEFPLFFITESETTQTMFKYSNYGLPTNNGMLRTMIPNTRFYFLIENEPSIPILISPENRDLITEVDVELTWGNGDNVTGNSVYLSTNRDHVATLNDSSLLASNVTDISLNVTGLDHLTTYYWRVSSYNDLNEFTAQSDVWSFDTQAPGNALVIGNGTETNKSLPMEPDYSYTISQSIYLNQWFDVGNQRIEEIAYYYNGYSEWTEDNIQIFMGATDFTEFSDTNIWVPFDDLVEVYNGPFSVPAEEGWVNIQLLMPFTLPNTDNLVVAFESNTYRGSSSADQFLCSATPENHSWYKRSHSANYDFVNPPEEGNLSAHFPNTLFKFGALPTTPILTVSDDEINWEATSLSTNSAPSTISLRNIGIDSIVINSVSLDQTTDFTLTDTNTYPLDIADNVVQFDIAFNPMSVGDFTGTITITDSDNTEYLVTLAGSGYDPMLYNFPHFEGFEDLDGMNLPQDWSEIIVSTSIYSSIYTSTISAYEGSTCLRFADNGDETTELYVITPPISNISDLRVRFMAKASDAGQQLAIGTFDSNVGGTFTIREILTLTGDYQQFIHSFNDYEGTDTFIGLKHIGTEQIHEATYVDNFFIENIPTGPAAIVYTDTLDFGEVSLNRTAPSFFEVHNWGISDLTVTVNTTSEYSFPIPDFTLEPSSIFNVQVNLTPQAEGEFLDSFTVTTNDPNFPEVTVWGKAFVLPAQPENITIIGNQELTNQQMPIAPNFGYTYSQVIYYANEIGFTNKKIEKISWYYNGNSEWSGDEIEIYLGYTDLNSFPDFSGWIDINDLMTVYSGTIDVTAEAGWVELELDIPFIYNNSRNLVVAVDENTQGWHANDDRFYATASPIRRGRVYNSYDHNPNPITPSGSNTMYSYADIKLEFSDLPNEPELTVYPTNTVFDVLAVDEESLEKIFTMWSVGLQDVTIATNPTITGVDSDQFTISSDNNTYPLVLPSTDISTFGVRFTPTTEGIKYATIEIVDEVTRTTHVVDISGYAYVLHNNDTPADAITLTLPVDEEYYTIMPEADVDWYKITSMNALDTLLVNVDASDIDMSVKLYGPTYTPAEIDLNNPIATGSYEDDDFIVGLTDIGDYYLRISEYSTREAGTIAPYTRKNSNGSDERTARELTGLYELHVDAIYGYYFNAPIDLTCENQNGFVQISWTDPDVNRDLVSYDIYRDEDLNDIGRGAIINDEPIDIGTNEYNDTSVIVGTTYGYTIVANYEQPEGESLHSNQYVLTYHNVGAPVWGDDFEDYVDFSLISGSWIQYDEDGNSTYTISDVDFANSGSPMSFIVFNPSATTPPLQDMQPQSGDKLLCSFASTEGSNSDWIITPTFSIDTTSVLSFYARSYTDQYDLESFRILISLGGDEVEDFIYSIHPEEEYLTAPNSWTPYYFNVSEFAGYTIRIALNCISENGFIFMADNFRFDSSTGTPNIDNNVVPMIADLAQNYPNPFNPETTISYAVPVAGDVTIDIYNLRGQKVKNLVNDTKNAGNHTVVWNGKDSNNKSVASGVYFYKMKSGKFIKTKKMILMK